VWWVPGEAQLCRAAHMQVPGALGAVGKHHDRGQVVVVLHDELQVRRGFSGTGWDRCRAPQRNAGQPVLMPHAEVKEGV
jgi:hypothetical protein